MIPEDWNILTLENAMESIIDYRGKTPKKTDSGIPLITAKIVKNGRILEPNEFISPQDYESWMRRGLPKPDKYGGKLHRAKRQRRTKQKRPMEPLQVVGNPLRRKRREGGWAGTGTSNFACTRR